MAGDKALLLFFRTNVCRGKDGLIIENTMLQTISGVRKVVDDVDGEHRENEV